MPLPLLLGGAVATGLLGAAFPSRAEVLQKIFNGIPYTAHIDEGNSPCGGRGKYEGCHAQTYDGSHHIWHSSIAPQWVIDHELAHLNGMEHSPWQQEKSFWGDIKNCSLITRAGGGYDLDTKICNTPAGETRERINGLLNALTKE